MSTEIRLPRLLSVRAVSELTTLPKSTVYDAIARGDLIAIRIGRAVRVADVDVRTWLARCQEPRP